MTSRRASEYHVVAWALRFCFSIAVIIALRAASRGDLRTPPITSIDALDAWTDAREPAAIALAAVRAVAELGAWYLLGLSALFALSDLLGARGAGTLARALALPGAIPLVRGGVGLGLVASAATTVVATDDEAISAAPDSSTAAMQPTSSGETDSTAAMAPVGDRSPISDPSPTPVPAPVQTPAPAPTWSVAPGESFWSIATDVLVDRLGREPSTDEVDSYWRRLVDGNRSRLIDEDDANLIHPGQVFDLPPS